MFKAAAMDNYHTWVEVYAESAYIQKCVKDASVIKNMPIQANEKLWMTSEVHVMLKAQNNAFKSSDMVTFRKARANLNHAIAIAKGLMVRKCRTSSVTL